jgi:hypothetical protein
LHRYSYFHTSNDSHKMDLQDFSTLFDTRKHLLFNLLLNMLVNGRPLTSITSIFTSKITWQKTSSELSCVTGFPAVLFLLRFFLLLLFFLFLLFSFLSVDGLRNLLLCSFDYGYLYYFVERIISTDIRERKCLNFASVFLLSYK